MWITCTSINKYLDHCQNGTGTGLSKGANYTQRQLYQIQQTKCQSLKLDFCASLGSIAYKGDYKSLTEC